jgi:hypothetical protein
MLHARNLAHQAFQRVGDETRYLLGGSAGVAHEDIDHGYRNLRVFLPRREHQAHEADGEAYGQQQRRER